MHKNRRLRLSVKFLNFTLFPHPASFFGKLHPLPPKNAVGEGDEKQGYGAFIRTLFATR